MKGLIRHNIYVMTDKLKLTILINFAITFVFAVVGIWYPFVYSWAAVVVLLQISSFSVQAVSTLQADTDSQWNRFEITMPITRKQVIGARYISFILYGLLGVITTVVSISVFYFFQTNLNFERIMFSLSFGIVLLFMVPALMHPLLLLFGADKLETVLTISIGAATVWFVGASMLFNWVMPGLENLDFIFRGVIIIISGIFFALSGMISMQVYQKKEL